MIEYQYRIERITDEKGTVEIFKPTLIPTTLPNISYIEAPNSSGKSTLLNIIGLSFFGHKHKHISSGLVNKMQDLLDVDHQKIEFKIKISSRDGSTALIAEKKLNTQDIKVFEVQGNNQIALSYDNFQRKYNLLYTIPDNPIDKLKSLTDEIAKKQNLFSEKLFQLRLQIKTYLDEINQKNPETLVKNKKYETQLKEEVEDLDKERKTLSKLRESLEKSGYYHFIAKFKEELGELRERINTLEKGGLQKTEQKVKRKSRKSETLEKTLQTNLKNMLEQYRVITHHIAENKPLLNAKRKKELATIEVAWNDLQLSSALSDLEFPTNLSHCITKMRDLFSSVKGEIDSDVLKEARMYRELINVLESYKNLNLKLPGEKTVLDFIKELETVSQSKQRMVDLFSSIGEIIAGLNELSLIKSNVERDVFPKLKSLQKEISETEQDIEEIITIQEGPSYKELKQEESNLIQKIKDYEKKFQALGSPIVTEICPLGEGELKDYFYIEEDNFIKIIKDLNNQVDIKEGERARKEARREIIRKNNEDMEKLKDHKYQGSHKELQKLLEIATSLESKFTSEFNEYLNDIIRGRSSKAKISEKQRDYNNAVFEYLGRRMGKILHIDKEYDVLSIDLIEKKIRTKEGIIIKFTDLGTGQSQSAYLTSLLTAETDRKIIAMFDEIAMMDQRSLDRVNEKIKTLYEKGALLMALLVEKRDLDVKIRNLEEEV